MLTVLGIIGLVVALSLPLLVPIMRTRKIDACSDAVKSACILARSKAIQQRRMINVTLLQQTDATHGAGIIITDYDTVRESVAGLVTACSQTSISDSNKNWSSFNFSAAVPPLTVGIYSGGNLIQWTTITGNGQTTLNTTGWPSTPAKGNAYIIMNAFNPSSSPNPPYCAHYLGNYDGNADLRFNALKAVSLSMGEQVRYLPEGCQFVFPTPAGWPPSLSDAWTYIFLPTGEAWTAPVNADNLYSDATNGSQWYRTTFVIGGTPSGPMLYAPQNKTSAGIVVYATTGQATSR